MLKSFRVTDPKERNEFLTFAVGEALDIMVFALGSGYELYDGPIEGIPHSWKAVSLDLVHYDKFPLAMEQLVLEAKRLGIKRFVDLRSLSGHVIPDSVVGIRNGICVRTSLELKTISAILQIDFIGF